MAFRAALHQAGAAAFSHSLQFPEPAADQCIIACPCGMQAPYCFNPSEWRSENVLGSSTPQLYVKEDISTWQKRAHFYLALTPVPAGDGLASDDEVAERYPAETRANSDAAGAGTGSGAAFARNVE